MTQQDIQRILDYCGKATAGPWSVDTCCVIRKDVGPERWTHAQVSGGFYGIICETTDYDDCRSLEFIANARTDLPAAIAEIERLKAELEAIRDTADSVVAARAKVELPPDSPLNAAVFCLAKAFRDIGRGLET